MKYFNRITFIIALNTFQGFSRDRIFHATMLISLALVFFAYALSALSIIEAQKLLLDFGFVAISISGVLFATFIGISSLSREIESKAIYTILSKPISRVSYLLGKYLGCVCVLLAVHVMMSFSLTVIVLSLGLGLPKGLLACYYLMYLESTLILAVALFSSIFSSSILATCFTIGLFLIGRSEYAFRSLAERPENKANKFLFQVLYDILPNLDRFNVREITAYSKAIPAGMTFMSSIYCFSYAAAFLIISSVIFMRKDMP